MMNEFLSFDFTVISFVFHPAKLVNDRTELDHMVAEAHQGGLDRQGTFPVCGGWESDQWGVKCTAVALINFPPLIVCSRLLRLLGLTRENSAAHRLCSGFDPFAAPQTADFACNHVCSHTGWKFMFKKKKHFLAVNFNSSVWLFLFEGLCKTEVTATFHRQTVFYFFSFYFFHKSPRRHKCYALECKVLLKQRKLCSAPPLGSLI